MKKVFKHIFVLLILNSLSGNLYAALNVETATQDLAAIAKAVGGEYVDVHSLTPGTRDPHHSVAKPSMIRKVYSADLLLVVGADLEIGWLPALLQSARNDKVLPGNSGYLDLSMTIPLLGQISGPVTRDMGDVHARGNPHYWLDPRNGVRMAKAIAQRLAELDPAHATAYQKNAADFTRQLETKLAEWRSALQFLKGKPVIAYHSSLLYLADAFGFKIVDEVEPKPGISPSAASLAKLMAKIKNEHIKLLMMEPYYERRSASYLSEQTGVNVAVLPQSVGAEPGIKTYIDLFDSIVKVLKTTGVK
jgi:zinc/manganese transport system substrate-binding protein